MKILVLEDEIYAAEKLKKLIKEAKSVNNTAKTIDWGQSINEGKELLTSTKYDLIFSDIELLDGNVFELYKNTTLDTPIIFCTSYDNFYIDAFQTNGIAYLLKPYSEDEFEQAWSKYHTMFKKEEPPTLSNEIVQQLLLLQQQPVKQYKSSLIAKKKNESYIVQLHNISHFVANGEYVKVFDTTGKIHILHISLGDLLNQVNPEQFFQINRGEAINRSSILSFEPYIKSRLAIHLHTHSDPLYTSNSKSSLFKRWIENH